MSKLPHPAPPDSQEWLPQGKCQQGVRVCPAAILQPTAPHHAAAAAATALAIAAAANTVAAPGTIAGAGELPQLLAEARL